MSFESNLKSMTESLKVVAEKLSIIADKLTEVEASQPTKPAVVNNPPNSAPFVPAPSLQETNEFLISASNILQDEGDTVRKVMLQQGVGQLADLANDPAGRRHLVDAVKTCLPQPGAAT